MLSDTFPFYAAMALAAFAGSVYAADMANPAGHKVKIILVVIPP
jgi:hypothetical protein